MEQGIENVIRRKLLTTFVATITFSGLMVYGMVFNYDGFEYNKGHSFLGWLLVYCIYVGVVILLYGNIVSLILDAVQRKWFLKKDWLTILILGVFGLANGLFFQEKALMWLGMLVAILYGVIDKWLYKRQSKGKSLKMFVLMPIAFIFLSWLFLQWISPPQPPFTKEDAITTASAGMENLIYYFPKEVGSLEETIDGYNVVRETSVKVIGNEKYIVTFKENWQIGNSKNTWLISYTVERNTSTLYAYEGVEPSYYKYK
ncbi:hypothetical protein MKY15_14485 [Sporosarcina sp. FSL K6-1540]|uniref:hypothetical protein n=1 Tax=Sporosarcina sp. FSL K6-1540 TaxID=2921555 RepID=UPI00315AD337